MIDFIILFIRFFTPLFKARIGLQAENLALRLQLGVLQRWVKRAKVRPMHRLFWCVLSRIWSDWKEALIFAKPDTVIRWQRRRLREHWTRFFRQGEAGRPTISKEVRELIRIMSRMNPTLGSPHIMGELAKLGITVAKSTVEKYTVRTSKPPSQTWRSFLTNHAKEIVSIHFNSRSYLINTSRRRALRIPP